MTTFLLIALALTLIAALILLLPLRKTISNSAGEQEDNLKILREQLHQLEIDFREGRLGPEQLKESRQDIAKRLLQEESAIAADMVPRQATVNGGRAIAITQAIGPALAISIGLPILGIVFYLWVGSPFAVGLDGSEQSSAVQSADGRPVVTQEQIERMVKQLETKLEAEPNNPEGWQMLARSYANLQRLPEATKAYAKALALSPEDPLLMIDYADLLAYQKQSTTGEPMRLIEKALVLVPDNLKALALAGTAYYEAGDYAKAEKLWARGRALVPPESAFAQSMTENIQAARDAAANKK